MTWTGLNDDENGSTITACELAYISRVISRILEIGEVSAGRVLSGIIAIIMGA